MTDSTQPRSKPLTLSEAFLEEQKAKMARAVSDFKRFPMGADHDFVETARERLKTELNTYIAQTLNEHPDIIKPTNKEREYIFEWLLDEVKPVMMDKEIVDNAKRLAAEVAAKEAPKGMLGIKAAHQYLSEKLGLKDSASSALEDAIKDMFERTEELEGMELKVSREELDKISEKLASMAKSGKLTHDALAQDCAKPIASAVIMQMMGKEKHTNHALDELSEALEKGAEFTAELEKQHHLQADVNSFATGAAVAGLLAAGGAVAKIAKERDAKANTQKKPGEHKQKTVFKNVLKVTAGVLIAGAGAVALNRMLRDGKFTRMVAGEAEKAASAVGKSF